MEQLRDMNLAGMTIIEHRAYGVNVVGKIDGCGVVFRDGALHLSWHHHDGLCRTTTFLSSCWECEIVADVIFLIRIAKNPLDRGDLTNPWDDANLYTIVQQARP